MAIRSNKREQVINYLLEELKDTPPGGKLSSNLKIQKACSVSQTIVTRAIDELKAMNLVEIRPQSGFYKKTVNKTDIHIVVPIKKEEKDNKSIFAFNSFYNNHLNAIQYVLLSHGYNVYFHHPNSLADLSFFQQMPSSPSLVRDIIITFSLPRTQFEEVLALEKRGFRFIHWLPSFIEPCFNSITIDEHMLVERQIRFLVDRGHRRIAYAHRCRSGSWSRPSNGRFDEFCRQSITYQLQVLPEYLFYLDARDTPQEECDRIIARLMSTNPAPTAMIIVDEDAKIIYNSLRLHGIEPGRDIAVLGTNNHNWGDFMTPSLSSVGFDVGSGTDHLLNIVRSDQKSWNFPAWNFPIVCMARESTEYKRRHV